MEEEKSTRKTVKKKIGAESSEQVMTDTAIENTKLNEKLSESKSGSLGGSVTVKKKRSSNENEKGEQILFASVPDSFTAEDILPVEFDTADEEEIEKSAIESLGEGPSLDSLLYDGEEELPGHETPEENAGFESFLADYKEVMANTLSMAKDKKEFSTGEPADEEYADGESKEEELSAEEEEDAPLFVKEKPEAEEATEVEKEDKVIESDTRENEQIEIDELISAALSEEESEDVPKDIPQDLPEESNKESVAMNELSEVDFSEEENEGEQLEIDLGILPEQQATAERAEESSDNGEDSKEKPKEAEEKVGILRSLFDFVELFVFTLLAVMLVTTFVFRHSMVDGSSMDNTLHDGDHLIISNMFYKADYNDIVVFTSERNDGSVLVKRVVALEGDEVDCFFADGKYTLYVNNELVDESEYKTVSGEGDVLTEVTDYIVPEGHVFVLGDHRNVSHDSRAFLAIEEDRILGKVVLRFFPFDKFGTVK